MRDEQKFSRRTFLKLASGAAVLAGGGFLVQRFGLLERAAKRLGRFRDSGRIEALFVRQIITSDLSVSRTIMWQSWSVQSAAAVEWREEGESSAQRAVATNEDFTDDGRASVLHVADIEGLSPGRRYEYRLVNGEEASDWLPLLAAPAQAGFKALIFPDSQSSDYAVWRDVAQGAWQRNPDAGFFVNMGDLVDNGEDNTQWDAWLSAAAPMIERIPLAPVMGNHETYDRNWQVRLPEAYLQEFAVPGNGSETFLRYYYSFDYGSCHFAVLNTQLDETRSFKRGLLEEQLAWLAEDMEKSRKNWKVALLHKDVLQYRIHGRPERTEGISDIGEAFMPVFDMLGIDLVFTAHLHTYRNRGCIQAFRRAAKGPVYILTGVAGDVRYPNLWVDHALDQTVAPQPETDNYLVLEAKESSLAVECFLPDGTKIDRVEVVK